MTPVISLRATRALRDLSETVPTEVAAKIVAKLEELGVHQDRWVHLCREVPSIAPRVASDWLHARGYGDRRRLPKPTAEYDLRESARVLQFAQASR